MEFKCKIDCLENHLRFSKQSILKLIFLSHKPSPIHLDQLSGGIRLISSMFKEMSCRVPPQPVPHFWLFP